MAILDSHHVHLPDSGVVFWRLLRDLFCHRCAHQHTGGGDGRSLLDAGGGMGGMLRDEYSADPSASVKAIRKGADERKSNSDALKGQIGEVTQTIVAGGYGRVKLDGDDWKAEAPGCREDIAEGARVRVKGHQSIILQVEEF